MTPMTKRSAERNRSAMAACTCLLPPPALRVTMAGPNLELFKFSLYLFFPLAIMIHYGDPQWYHDNVRPVRDKFWPDEASLYVSGICDGA